MKLPLSFYLRPTQKVAKDLLGKTLVRIFEGQRLSGIITEVEAYLGLDDKACHSYLGRRTARTEVMFAAGGRSYIYFIYGMYNCFNVVTEKEGRPEAVLIRALEPVEGIPTMQHLRGKESLKDLTTGPGKLAQALALTKTLNNVPLDSEELFIEDAGVRISSQNIVRRPRIGVGYAEEHAELPLRFYIGGSQFISKL